MSGWSLAVDVDTNVGVILSSAHLCTCCTLDKNEALAAHHMTYVLFRRSHTWASSASHSNHMMSSKPWGTHILHHNAYLYNDWCRSVLLIVYHWTSRDQLMFPFTYSMKTRPMGHTFNYILFLIQPYTGAPQVIICGWHMIQSCYRNSVSMDPLGEVLLS